jgi:hypothetical protein
MTPPFGRMTAFKRPMDVMIESDDAIERRRAAIEPMHARVERAFDGASEAG